MPQDKPLSGARILIAEDNAIQAFDLKTSLEKAGAEVIGPAGTLAQALALAESAPLTCAVLDIILRRESVFPAAQLLKERGMPMIYLTGSSDLASLRRNWPQAQIVTKPASVELLVQAICRSKPCQRQT